MLPPPSLKIAEADFKPIVKRRPYHIKDELVRMNVASNVTDEKIKNQTMAK